jgi:predicted protein tyrosine phosphatase
LTYGNHVRTTLRFHDIISPIAGQIMPAPDHVEAVLKFGEAFLARQDSNASSHVLVHCHMGISRSTAAMITLMAQADPDETSEALFERLTKIRPQAWPNSKMIPYADSQLGRNGDLTTALRRHYARHQGPSDVSGMDGKAWLPGRTPHGKRQPDIGCDCDGGCFLHFNSRSGFRVTPGLP